MRRDAAEWRRICSDEPDASHRGHIGRVEEEAGGSGRFIEVVLRPQVVISLESDPDKALALHSEAHPLCFIASSVNFPVRNEPQIKTE